MLDLFGNPGPESGLGWARYGAYVIHCQSISKGGGLLVGDQACRISIYCSIYIPLFPVIITISI